MEERAALKEWELAIRALAEGTQIVLLRKGGIVEETGEFDVVSPHFLLYPTFYHQDANILKAAYRSWLEDARTEAPEAVPIALYAEVSDVVPLSDPEAIDALDQSHIWTTDYMKDRFFWKPEKPLTLMLLRVFRLDQEVSIPVRREYTGCLSWIQLSPPVDVTRRSAVLTDASFARERDGILDALSISAG
jgi:hypothetical protein